MNRHQLGKKVRKYTVKVSLGPLTANSIRKGPKVQLVKRLIVDIRAHTLSNIKSIASSLSSLSEMLLLVTNVMLGASNNTSILDTLDRLRHKRTSQSRVRRETLPVSATVRRSAKRAGNRSQLDVDALSSVFLTHCLAPKVGELLVPSRSDIDTSGEGRNVISW